jgi:hypothetical protein
MQEVLEKMEKDFGELADFEAALHDSTQFLHSSLYPFPVRVSHQCCDQHVFLGFELVPVIKDGDPIASRADDFEGQSPFSIAY